MYKLVIEDDEGNKTVVPVIRDEITIGRKEGNTIRLTERNVSRRHARLVRDAEEVYLEEVAARYGTKKNGEKIDGRVEFGPGDVFTIGDYRLTLQTETEAEPAPPKPASKPNGNAPPPKAAAKPPEKPAPGGFTDEPTEIKATEEVERTANQGTEILPAMPAKLVIVSSNFAGQEFPLKKKEMVIGRGEDCDIIIDHRSVSQKHAKVVREPSGNYKIVDLNSKNGVKVSGEEYRAVHMKRGDIVELGHVKFRFVEPGENYVFQPKSELDEFEPAVGRSSSSNPVVLAAIIAAAVVVVGGGVYWLTQGSSDDATASTTTTAPKDDSKAVAAKEDEAGVDEEESKTHDKKVARAIAKAQEAIKMGDMEKAIASLDSAREFLDPDPDAMEKIEKLLSKARREKPFARELAIGKDHFDNERYAEALSNFKNIPPDSAPTIYRIMTEEKLPEKAIDGLLEQAKKAAEEEKYDEAEALAKEILLYDPEHERAAAFIKGLEAKQDTKPVAIRRPKNNGSTSNDDNPRPKNPTKPKKPAFEPDPAKAEAAFSKAQQAVIRGRYQDAISHCKVGLKHGNSGCHRILGVAYKNLEQTNRACSHFNKAGISNPPGLDCP